MERWAGDNEKLIGYCIYCKNPIYEGEGLVYVRGNYYHYDPYNPYKNCYFPETEEEE